jgi:hypothetical protein
MIFIASNNQQPAEAYDTLLPSGISTYYLLRCLQIYFKNNICNIRGGARVGDDSLHKIKKKDLKVSFNECLRFYMF